MPERRCLTRRHWLPTGGRENVQADAVRRRATPTFATGGVREQKRLYFQRRRARGLHYRACAGARWTECAVAILGGGCGGRSRLSWRTSSLWSALSSVWRVRIRVGPSVVGKWTSSIWIAANVSSTA